MTAQAEDELYELSLKGHGLSIARKVDVAIANAIVNLVMGSAPATSAGAPFVRAGQGEDSQSRTPRIRVSLREFIDGAGATRYPDKIVAIAQYMAEHEGAETFTRDDIKGRFRSAGEAAPGNFPRDFALTVSSGWVAEDSRSSGNYYVTKKGMDVISAGFAADIKKPVKTKRRRGGFDRAGVGDGGDE